VSGVRAEFALKNPDALEATLTLTMTMGEWRRLLSQIVEAGVDVRYPAWKVLDAMRAVISAGDQHFAAEHEIPS
jgi:hypothetical protein